MKKKTTKKREGSRPALKDLSARRAHSVKGGLAASQLNNTSRLSSAGSTASSGEASVSQ
jgi:hypothetical protein